MDAPRSYAELHAIAVATDLPVAVVPMLEDGEPELWWVGLDGPPEMHALLRWDPAGAALVACMAAHQSARRAGLHDVVT